MRRSDRSFTALRFLLPGMFLLAVRAAAQEPIVLENRVLVQRLLASIDPIDPFLANIRISPDGRHIACILSGNRVFLDGETSPPYQGIQGHVIFSPDGKRCCYVAMDKDEVVLVEEGKRSRGYLQIPAVAFSPDGSRLGYIAQNFDKDHFLIVDGKVLGRFERILEFAFSPDGGRVAARIESKGKKRIVMDGKEGKAYDEAFLPVFSRDCKRYAHFAKNGYDRYYVVDGKETPPYERVLVKMNGFSPDGKRFLFFGIRKGKMALVQDRKEGPFNLDLVDPDSFSYSADGTRFAYHGWSGEKHYVFLDGKQHGPYDQVMQANPVFSPDGKRVAYCARTGAKWKVVFVGEKEFESDDVGMGSLKFSPDSLRSIFAAKEGTEWRIVLDGTPGTLYEAVTIPHFSADGKEACWAGSKDADWFVVRNGIEENHYEQLLRETPFFTVNGPHVVGVLFGGGSWFTVVDGVEGRPYDRILWDGTRSAVHNPPDSVSYFAMKGANLYHVTETIGQPK